MFFSFRPAMRKYHYENVATCLCCHINPDI